MDETKSSTGDSEKSRLRGSPRLRLVAVGAVVLAAMVFVFWIRNVTWQRIAELESKLFMSHSDRFLLGVHARESIVRMDAALLSFELSGDTNEQNAFRRIEADLTNRLNLTIPALSTANERTVAEKFRKAFERYRAETFPMFADRTHPVRRFTAGQVKELIRKTSDDVRSISEDLVVAQSAALNDFFADSGRVLTSLRQMLWISVIALLLFTTVLGVLAYGTFVAPLRAMLTQSQAVIERHEKLASLGTLAAGVAHEIRNPLQAIKMRLFSLNKSLPVDMKGNEDLTVISSEINRLEKIVKETLQFARPGEPEMTNVQASDLLIAVADLLGGAMRKRGVQLEAEATEKVFVRVDRQQIQQVLINLVLNASESMEGNGTVMMRAHADIMTTGGQSRPVVRIEVSDTGRGISPQAERRMFDPFFSTKEGGTGLGLSIAARIVEKHGGFIHYSTRLGRGTTFSIVLPQQAQ